MSYINNELIQTLLLQREEGVKHRDYECELSFYELVKTGNLEGLRASNASLTDEGLGKLSNNDFRNLLYHYIVGVSLITRFCIEGGLEAETAYTLSDLYIQKADLLYKKEDLLALHKEMYLDFATRMNQLYRKGIYSPHIVRCMDYIDNHLLEALSIDAIAHSIGLSKSYLCALFKKELGTTIGSYIESKRIDNAKDLLAFSSYSFVEISNYLCFNSHSHFIQTFRKHTGMTPKQYRKVKYRHYFT